MAAPGAVTFLLVLASVVPALLVNGCPDCGTQYRACGGRCYRVLDNHVTFDVAKEACHTEGRENFGDARSIQLAAPQNATESACALETLVAAGRNGAWLGICRKRKFMWSEWQSCFSEDPLNYSDAWAAGQPGWFEDNVALIPPDDPKHNEGWHDWVSWAEWYPLCQTQFCP